MPQSTMARASLALVLGTLLAFAGYLAWSQLRSAPPGVVVTQVAGSGQPLVGGSFELTDQYGATRRESEFRGQFMLVYFGYSNCPDVCPIALSAMSDALDELAAGNPALEEKVVPIFITVDPKNDTVEFLKDYTANFHPRLVALTGSHERLEEAAKAYRIYHKKSQMPEMSGMEDHGVVLIDHTSLIYVMDPAGGYVTNFPHDSDSTKIADKLREVMQGS